MNRIITIALLLIGALLLSQGLYMSGKAKVAQILISSSWNLRADDRPPPKPWWWADTRAIAKLQVTRLQQTVYVMQDDSSESLAFGPGHMPNSAKPAENGHVMIAGHRDSHFEFLQDIQIGDIINTSNYQAKSKQYQVTNISVMDTTKEQLSLFNDDILTLITCYPFNELITGGPLRYIVHAQPLNADQNPLL